jgi:hypothetical protein
VIGGNGAQFEGFQVSSFTVKFCLSERVSIPFGLWWESSVPSENPALGHRYWQIRRLRRPRDRGTIPPHPTCPGANTLPAGPPPNTARTTENNNMTLNRQRLYNLVSLGLLAGFSTASLQACDDSPLGDIAEQCGLVCADEGIADGNASISGNVSIDAFFSSVIAVRGSASVVADTVRAEITGLAGILCVNGDEESCNLDVDLPALTAAVRADLDAKFAANVEGSLTVEFQAPKCEASLEASVSAAAECDVQADPGSIEASCEGSCEVSASVAADCAVEGNLSCEGKAPGFTCEGSCTGSCQLDVAATCGGSCEGSCEGSCNVCTGGACDDDGTTVANCAGECSGMCTGTCELSAGGMCNARCEGSCKTEPGSVMCEAGATAKCDASAMADVECSGKCEGSVTPPSVSAECEASVEASAKAEVECTPPQLAIDFRFSAAIEADVDAKADFLVFVENFKLRFAALLAARAKLEIVGEAAVGLSAAATGAVQGAVNAQLEGDLDLKATIGLGCALGELDEVGAALSGAVSDIDASVSAVIFISGSVGG